MYRGLEAVSCSCAQHLLDTFYLSRFMNFRILIWFSWDPWLCVWAFFSPNPNDCFKGRQRVCKLHKHWANSVQANCDRRRSSCPSSSLSLKEVAVYLHRRILWPSIFLIFIVWMKWRTLQPTTFLVCIEVAYWDPRNWLVTYLGTMHWKGELSLQNKSNWVLG